jgi:hypothetical protein
MVRGWGTRAGKVLAALSATLAFLALSAGALAAGPDAPPVLKPDPPPKAQPAPPPPPAARQAPVTPSVQPVAPRTVAPVVVHPTAAERRAAAARRVAKARATRAAALAANRRQRVKRELSSPIATANSPSASALPYLIIAFGAGLLLLGLALTPATAVPWSRVSRILEDRREELAVLGGAGLVATVFFFLLGQMTT